MSYFEQILKTNGFTTFVDQGKSVSREIRVLCISQSHQIPPYNKRTPNQQISVDLNHDLFWGEYTGKRIDISDFLDHTIEMNIYGCIVKTLPPIKAMVQLVLHHYKDMNSIYRLAVNNCINYNMFKDVFSLEKSQRKKYLWKSCMCLARNMRLSRMFSMCYISLILFIKTENCKDMLMLLDS